MRQPPGTLQMQVLQTLSQTACKTPATLADETALERKQVVKIAAALVMRGLADRRERGCYVRNNVGEAFLLSGQKITSGPIGSRENEPPRRRVKRTVRQSAWHAIRIEKKFTLSDIMADVACQGDGLKQLQGNIGRFVNRLADMRRLPEIVDSPEAVYLDRQGDPALLYVYQPKATGRKGKVVVRVDFQTHGRHGQAGTITNSVRTSGTVEPGDLKNPRYVRLK